MKRLAITVSAFVILVSSASAHELSSSRAQRVARAYVESIASAIYPAPQTAVFRCAPQSKHVRDCRARFRFPYGTCRRVVRVRLFRDSNGIKYGFLTLCAWSER